MGFGGAPSPPPVPAVPPAANPPVVANSGVAATAAGARSKAAALEGNGENGTAGPLGAQGQTVAPNSAGAKLLGGTS